MRQRGGEPAASAIRPFCRRFWNKKEGADMSQRRFFQTTRIAFDILLSVAVFAMGACQSSRPAPDVHDPGVRGGQPGAGGPLPGLTPDEAAFFQDGLGKFVEVDSVPQGLGPRFNSNQRF